MEIEHKNALGLFPDLQHTESALDQLKAAGFPMSNVSVVVQDLDSKVIKGTDPEISQAQAVLKTANIQDWTIIYTL
jgi:hypothetical protein